MSLSLTNAQASLTSFNGTIGIVGLGLIGGCLAIDLKRLGYTVYGVARREVTVTAALDQEIVTQAACDLNLMSQADVVFVCTPWRQLCRRSNSWQIVCHHQPS